MTDPIPTEITHHLSRGVTVRLLHTPAAPPFVPDDDELQFQQCPYCSRIITIDDAGLTYCPHCRHILFTDDDCKLLSPDVGSVSCPDCGAFIDLDGDVNPSLSDFCLRGLGVDLFCTDCGKRVEWDHAVQAEFEFLFPNTD